MYDVLEMAAMLETWLCISLSQRDRLSNLGTFPVMTNSFPDVSAMYVYIIHISFYILCRQYIDIAKITKELKDTLTKISAMCACFHAVVAFSVDLVERVPLRIRVKVFLLHLDYFPYS